MLRQEGIRELIWSNPSLDREVPERSSVLLRGTQLMRGPAGNAGHLTVHSPPLLHSFLFGQMRTLLVHAGGKSLFPCLEQLTGFSLRAAVHQPNWNGSLESLLRCSRNQLPVSPLVKLVSRCLHFKLRMQEEAEGLGVC